MATRQQIPDAHTAPAHEASAPKRPVTVASTVLMLVLLGVVLVGCSKPDAPEESCSQHLASDDCSPPANP